MSRLTDNIGNRTFGMEVECHNIGEYGRGDIDILRDIDDFEGAHCWRQGYGVGGDHIQDRQGRRWSFCSDGSLSGRGTAELVTPPLSLADMDLFHAVIDTMEDHAFRSSVDYGCGVHVHVGADDMTALRLLKLIFMFHEHEQQMVWGVCPDMRRGRWGRLTNLEFLRGLIPQAGQRTTKSHIRSVWYNTYDSWATRDQYNNSRYHALNLHCYFRPHTSRDSKTVEFRFFELDDRLDFTKLEAYALLSLGLVAKAHKTRRFRPEENDIYKCALRDKDKYIDWLVDELGFDRTENAAHLEVLTAHI